MGGKTERVEIKNISSIEDIGRAIEFEIARQMKERSVRETRRFDSMKGKTMRMRGKEEAEDYRFISDPDLRDIVIDKKFISEIENELPETPEEKLKKLVRKHGIEKKNAEVLAKNIDVVEFFEKVAEKIDAKFALPWVSVELLRFLNYNKKKLDEVNINVDDFVSLLKLVKEGKITELQGKKILDKFYPKSFNPAKKVEEKIDDEKVLEKFAEKVIRENSRAVLDYKAGEKKSFNFLLGKIMEATSRRADFKIAGRVLERLLKKR